MTADANPKKALTPSDLCPTVKIGRLHTRLYLFGPLDGGDRGAGGVSGINGFVFAKSS